VIGTLQPSSLPAARRGVHVETAFERTFRRGDRGRGVRRIQEWLSLGGHQARIDGVFGPATEYALRAFQERAGLQVDGIVSSVTHERLVLPMSRALAPITRDGASLGRLAVLYAEQHLAEHPREIGGQNRGPWVRLYMGGNEGRDWPWCAGFVSSILHQAIQTLGLPMPVPASFSCDVLAVEAQRRGRFVPEAEVARSPSRQGLLPAGSVFLARRTTNDWVHAGLVLDFGEDVLETVEANTNDDGDREGYEVCRRIRGYGGKDFIRIEAK